MKARFFALAVVAAGLAGCATDYVPPRPPTTPGPAYEREMTEGRPGLFGNLTWDIDLSGKSKAAEQAPQAAPQAAAPMTAAEQEEFKKWRESAGSTERQEFEEWRAWQEWKRKNPQ
jgi:hypothetical protein